MISAALWRPFVRLFVCSRAHSHSQSFRWNLSERECRTSHGNKADTSLTPCHVPAWQSFPLGFCSSRSVIVFMVELLSARLLSTRGAKQPFLARSAGTSTRDRVRAPAENRTASDGDLAPPANFSARRATHPLYPLCNNITSYKHA